MSRIGKLPIEIPTGVTVTYINNKVTVKGKLGELCQDINPVITVDVEENLVTLNRPDDSKENRSIHGLYRSLVNNMIEGVSKGYTKKLELVGVGYKAECKGQILDLSLGFSHHILLELSPEIKCVCETERRANSIITLTSFDKQLLGQVVAKVRSFRPPEPYKGKGIKFVGEELRRKAGKSASV